MNRLAAMIWALCLVCIAPHISLAQSVYGSIQGTVSDSTGAAIPGAAVTAREGATGITQKALTNQNGIYVLANLRPGTYDVTASGQGFGDQQHPGISVHIGDAISLDISLTVGGLASTVEVSTEAPQLRTEDTVVGSVIEEDTIKQLPLNGRSAFSLALLTPAVQQSAVSNGTSADSQPRLSGGRPRTNEVTLDGTSITDPRRGSSVIAPNLDAIQEFAVITNGIPAQYGRMAGGIITATLKSGTNDFHGNAFEFYQGSGMGAARNYFAASVPQLVFNQFGGIVGGPIKKNKVFFFADYQGTRDRSQSIYNITLPTAQEDRETFPISSERLWDKMFSDVRSIRTRSSIQPLPVRSAAWWFAIPSQETPSPRTAGIQPVPRSPRSTFRRTNPVFRRTFIASSAAAITTTRRMGASTPKSMPPTLPFSASPTIVRSPSRRGRG